MEYWESVLIKSLRWRRGVVSNMRTIAYMRGELMEVGLMEIADDKLGAIVGLISRTSFRDVSV